MLSTFLNQQWKDFWRSRNRGGSIASQILLGLFLLYFLALAVFAGFGMPFLLPKVFPNQDVIKSFNGLILYYFAIDFLMRLQLQELPTLSIIPYLHLNIAKKRIIAIRRCHRHRRRAGVLRAGKTIHAQPRQETAVTFCIRSGWWNYRYTSAVSDKLLQILWQRAG